MSRQRHSVGVARALVVTLVALLLVVDVSHASAADAFDWPLEFIAGFHTADATNVSSGLLSYSWRRRAMRIDHTFGWSRECAHHYGNPQCALIFDERGLFALLPDGRCCFDSPGVGAPRPTFARNMTSCGKSTVEGVAVDCFAFEPHTYFALANATSQLAEFTFPSALQSMVFVHEPYSDAVKLPASLFRVPAACEQRACSSGREATASQ